MAKLPHTSLTSIAITFLVMNVITAFVGFLCPFFQIMSFLPYSINKIDSLSNFRQLNLIFISA
jgi:predicted benzoate:H+ symporter BenE